MTLPVNGSTWAGGWAQSGVEASRAREKAMERFVMADTPGVFMVADFTSEIGKPFSARAFDSRWRRSLGWTLRQAATGWSILCSPEHTHCGRRNRHEQAMPDDRRRPPRPWCPPRLARLGGRDLDRAGGEGRRGGGRLGLTPSGEAHFTFAVPDALDRFTGAQVMVIGKKDGPITYDLHLSISRDGASRNAFSADATGLPASLSPDKLTA